MAQERAYKTAEWQRAYNLRSTVERKNSQLKHTGYENLQDPMKRPARGYTAHTLAVVMIATALNIREINNHLRAADGIDTSKGPRRAARRRSEEVLVGVKKQRDGRSHR
ncbi:hypothetical protein [Salinibacterium sp. ZJ70]|uniref:hypothetical protein n=1 Tax=Salinibacterium sp. ZJ70 TaxID=2708084 RepID=UPI00142368E4|nr:hypothetical protein [Salinibacterium sp. ZJ70]